MIIRRIYPAKVITQLKKYLWDVSIEQSSWGPVIHTRRKTMRINTWLTGCAENIGAELQA